MRRKNTKFIDPRYFMDEKREVLNENAGVDLQPIIQNALQRAELPADLQLRAYYHAAPSDRIFLVPQEDKYHGYSQQYRPKRNSQHQLVWPENRPKDILIDAGENVEAVLSALEAMGLQSISKGAYTGEAY